MSENTFERRPAARSYQSFFNRDAKANTDVYIVSIDQVHEVEKIKKAPDVIVVDDRNSPDPNMQVRHSYKIMNRESKAALIRILLDYNEEYPTNPAWKRTFHSLMAEWALHNIAYLLGVQPERTGHVDFNNDDEGKGLLDYLRKM